MRLLSRRAPTRGAERPQQGPPDVPRWVDGWGREGGRGGMFSSNNTPEEWMQLCPSVSATQRLAEFPGRSTLYLCATKKHDSKGKRKQLCSTFTVSHHVKCEGDESEAQTGGVGGESRREESDFLHPQIASRWWQGTGLSDTPPNMLHPPPPPPVPVIAPLLPPPPPPVCEVSPERQRFKDGIYKIHTEPTFNCL